VRAKLELKDPKPGRSPYYRVRGTYLGVYVDESTRTTDKKLAAKRLAQIRTEIERGQFGRRSEPTFLSATIAYIEAGGEDRYVGHYDESTGKWSGLIAHFGEKPLSKIDQAAVDAAAIALYPNASVATRNRQVYTPVSAVIRRAGIKLDLRRPKGANGEKRTDWLTPEQAFAVLEAASDDREWRAFLAFMLYTGCRLSEATSLCCDLVNLAEAWAHIPRTKNGLPREAHLPPALIGEMANHPRGLDRRGEPVFRFRKCGRIYAKLSATFAKAGVAKPGRVSFHIFRHSFGTWMRRYGGADTKALLSTGAWLDPHSAARYAHADQKAEARLADKLPAPPTRVRSV
jgi:integrase